MSEQSWEERQKAERIEGTKIHAATRAKLVEVFKLLGYRVAPVDREERTWDPMVWLRATLGDKEIIARANDYQNKGRAEFSAYYPKPERGQPYDRDWPKPCITVSLEKSPAQIVADIQRRLLPDYERGLVLARKANADCMAHYAKRDANLLAILGRKLTEYELKEGKTRFDGVNLGEVSASGYASEEDVSLDLHSVPVDLAVKILALLRKGAA